jgi:CBS domain containing-hemolysin-like protein
MVTEPVAAVAVVALLAASAFFSGSETSIFSLEAHRVAAMAERGDPGAGTLARLREDPHRLLITILVGNNVVNIAIASVTTAGFVARFDPGVATVAATVVVSVLVLLFGEIVPKSYAVGNPEGVARRVAGPIRLLGVVLRPVVVAFDTANEGLRRLVGGARDIERPYVTREELAALVDAAEEAGVVDADERAFIDRVFRFDDVTVREVMVPRADIVAVGETATVETATARCAAERVNRLPVRRDDEYVLGYVDLRDLVDADADAPVTAFMLPVVHAYEGRDADDLLAELQERGAELAVVFDEFGALEGLVTVEDIIEELVGEVFDVGEARAVSQIGPGRASARGVAPVDAVNDLLDTALPSAEGGSVAALLSREFGDVPEVGESVEAGGARLTVRAVEENRVTRVLVERLDAPDPEPGPASES